MQKSISRPKHLDMLNGPLLRNIFLFVIPLAASSILQQLFNSADVAVVGHFAGSQALAAVGSNGSIINLMVNLFVGLSTGGNAVIARYIGEGREDRIREAVHTVVAIALISGFVLILIGLTFSRVLLELVNSPEDVIDLAELYLNIYFLGMPFIMLYNFGSSILRSQGDTKRPLVILTFAGLVNICLNLIFVIVFNLGVAGVAIATVCSNAISSLLILRLLIKAEGPFKLDLRKLHIAKVPLISVIKIGVPSGIQSIVFSLSNMCIMSAVNSFGSACVAGNTSAANLTQYSHFIVNGFSQATVTFTSQNYGAKNFDRCKKVFKYSLFFSMLLVLMMNIIYIIFADGFVTIFSSDPIVNGYAVTRIRTIALFQSLCCVYEIPAAAMRGMGIAFVPMLISLVGTCVIRLLWVFFIFPLYPDYRFLLSIYPISWLITGIVMQFVYYNARRKMFEKSLNEKAPGERSLERA